MAPYLPAAYLQDAGSRRARVRLAQLHTGAHWLWEGTRRWEKFDRAFSTCLRCYNGKVDDASHMVFRCAAMDVVRIREQHAALFQGEVALESFFRQSAQEVAAFVSDCYAECQALWVDLESDKIECC